MATIKRKRSGNNTDDSDAEVNSQEMNRPISAIAARKKLAAESSLDGLTSIVSPSSDSEDELTTDLKPQVEKVEKLDPKTVSSFRPHKENVFICNDEAGNEALWIIGMQKGETLSFHGGVFYAILKGRINVHGFMDVFIEKPIFRPVIAPMSHPVATFRALQTEPALASILNRITDRGLFDHSKYACVVALSSISASGAFNISRVLASHVKKLFSKIKEPNWPSGFHPIFQALPGLWALQMPESWDATVNALVNDSRSKSSKEVIENKDYDARNNYQKHQSHPILQPFWYKKTTSLISLYPTCPSILICGSKGTGKSTFASYLVNRLLTKYEKIAYLDCDVGQTTFTPPGIVSLSLITEPMFGPTWAMQRPPYRSHFFGKVNTKDDPERYISLVTDLIEVYRMEMRGEIPLIVNTMGWIRGLGLDMLLQITQALRPTNIVQFESPVDPGRNFPDILTRIAGVESDIHLIAAYENGDSSSFPPVDNRDAAIISYFHTRHALKSIQADIIDKDLDEGGLCVDGFSQLADIVWDFSPLVNRQPLSLRFDLGTVVDSIHFILANGYNTISPLEVLRALNGVVVAFLRDQQRDVSSISSLLPHIGKKNPLRTRMIPYTRGSDLPFPQHTSLLALGLIRVIDPETREFHVVIGPPLEQGTPFPFESKISVSLIRGEINLPLSSIYGDVNQVRDAPYVSQQVTSENVVGLAARRFRRNIMRKSQRQN